MVLVFVDGVVVFIMKLFVEIIGMCGNDWYLFIVGVFVLIIVLLIVFFVL